ncbi:MAG: biotin--[acetyl-CoA-carboxylase] ligase [candidate division WOR-3 bacterium]
MNQERRTIYNLGVRVVHLESAESTQDECFRLLEEYPEVAVRADVQTRGRGRHGAMWYSPPGGLWLSVGMREADPFACAVAGPIAAINAVSPYLPIAPLIRPPNDVICSGRKLAGILVERRSRGVVTGFGVNLYQETFPPDLNAVSLRQMGARGFSLEGIAEALVSGFKELLGIPIADMIAEYNERLLGLGRVVRVGAVEGIFRGLSEKGFTVGESIVDPGRFTGLEIIE